MALRYVSVTLSHCHITASQPNHHALTQHPIACASEDDRIASMEGLATTVEGRTAARTTAADQASSEAA